MPILKISYCSKVAAFRAFLMQRETVDCHKFFLVVFYLFLILQFTVKQLTDYTITRIHYTMIHYTLH